MFDDQVSHWLCCRREAVGAADAPLLPASGWPRIFPYTRCWCCIPEPL